MCMLLMSFLGCDKSEPEDLSGVSVERYVELLKDGVYGASELPAFTAGDISALLAYRNESQVITGFPVNMISSFAMSECSLGMYVLWTIESIRAVAIDSEYLTGRFPSLNPIVEQREEPFEIENGSAVQEMISAAYHDWWENNQDQEFDEFKEIDPLADTEYRWR